RRIPGFPYTTLFRSRDLLVDRGPVAREEDRAVALRDRLLQPGVGLRGSGLEPGRHLDLPAPQAGRDLERREVEAALLDRPQVGGDRKSTRLNSSHLG